MMGVFTPAARSPQDMGPYFIGYSQLLIQDTLHVTLHFWRPNPLSVTEGRAMFTGVLISP